MSETSVRELTRTHIIACSVFRPLLREFRARRMAPGLRISYLPSNLHLNPNQLKTHFSRAVIRAHRNKERIICLYGDCFPDIDGFCHEFGATRISGFDCHEMLLGSETYRSILEETTGTYFLGKDLVVNFDELCRGPLELDDEEIREALFRHYRKLVYVRQPSDPDLRHKLNEVSEFLELPVEIRDADYSHLRKKLGDLILPLLPEGL